MKNYATRPGDLKKQPRCGARTRAGAPCQRPAIRGRKRCRLHGGLSPGAPRGSKNGNFRTGGLDLRGNQRAQMAAVSRAVVCQERDNRMTDKTNNSLTPVGHPACAVLPVNQPAGPSPVRVKLRRVNASLAKPYPPDGESKVWWKRLKKALGTKSSDFVNAVFFEQSLAPPHPPSFPQVCLRRPH